MFFYRLSEQDDNMIFGPFPSLELARQGARDEGWWQSRENFYRYLEIADMSASADTGCLDYKHSCPLKIFFFELLGEASVAFGDQMPS